MKDKVEMLKMADDIYNAIVDDNAAEAKDVCDKLRRQL